MARDIHSSYIINNWKIGCETHPMGPTGSRPGQTITPTSNTVAIANVLVSKLKTASISLNVNSYPGCGVVVHLL